MTLKKFYISYSLWAAILYTLFVAIYLFALNYMNVWLLFMGNILFVAVVLMGVIKGNHRVHDVASVRSLFMMGFKITIYGTLASTALCVLLLIINSFSNSLTSSDVPAQAGRGDIFFTILSNTIAVNLTLGALAALLGSSVVKRNQKSEEGKTLY
jgi:uncharacterized membrane protein